MYLQRTINDLIDGMKPKLMGRLVFPGYLAKLITKTFAHMGVEGQTQFNLNPDRFICFGVTGFKRTNWDWEAFHEKHPTYDKAPDIGIVVHWDPLKLFTYYNDNTFNTLKFYLSQVMQHELIHRWQGTRRNGHELLYVPRSQINGWPAYLANKEEIDAFAHCLSLDVSRRKLYNKLRNYSSLKGKSEVLATYFNHFPADHPVIKRLMKKCYLYHEHECCRWQP